MIAQPASCPVLTVGGTATAARLRRQIDHLTARLHREKQFNRKVEINQQIKPLQAEAALLTEA